jgi:GxxExxY protein
MRANHQWTRIDTNSENLLLKDEVFQIVGCAIEVLNTLVPDLIPFGSVVVDTKVIDKITDHERGLMLNYLRITGLRVDVILNFKHRKLEWERIAL